MATFGSIPTLSDYLVNGYWGGTGHHWADPSISVNITDLTTAEKTIAQKVLNLWHEVCDVDFTFTTGIADITYNNDSSGVAQTTASWSGTSMVSSTTTISSDWAGGAATGDYSYFFWTYLHETGHALGLGHQGPYTGSATYGVDNIFTNDTWQWSAMSYFSQDNFDGGTYDFVLTPAMADIHAAISVYGAQVTRAGDTVYGFNSTAGSFYNFVTYSGTPSFTLYDTGGIDKLDTSGYSVDQIISLTPGTWSSIGGYTHNIGIYLGTTIENAVGGSGNDTISGNTIANTLNGNMGNDTLTGGIANDTLNGGVGNDNLRGEVGNDTLNSGPGNDLLSGGPGNDLLNGSDGIDTVSYSDVAGAITVRLAVLTGQITGGAGTDTLSSVENLIGGVGNDALYGSSGSNVLDGGIGNDVLNGNSGADRLVGGVGNDVLTGGAGNDTFVFNLPTHGLDTVVDFVHGVDLIEISAVGFDHGLVAGMSINLVTASDYATASTPGTNGAFIFDNAGPNAGTVYWNENGGSGIDAMALVKLQGISSLMPSDFHVV